MSLRYNLSRNIPYFWTRSNFAILFVEHLGASTVCAFFSSNGRIFQPVHRAPRSRSNERLRIRGKIPRTAENVNLSHHSIWRVLLLHDLKILSVKRQGSNSIDLLRKMEGREALRSARISMYLTNPRFSLRLYLCTKNTRAIRHAESELVIRRWSVNSRARRAQAPDGKCVTVRPRVDPRGSSSRTGHYNETEEKTLLVSSVSLRFVRLRTNYSCVPHHNESGL